MRTKILLFLISVSGILLGGSCGKGGGGGGGNPPPPPPCQGVTITVDGTVTNTSGPGNNDGKIDATATGGNGFTFSINNGPFQASPNFAGLAAGNHTITAKDSRGCTGSKVFNIQQNDPCAGQTFTVGGTVVNATPCAPSPDGSITVNTAGGGGGFTYNLNNGAFQASPIFNNLAPNNYTIGAKEAGGCVKTTQVTVGARPAGPMFLSVKAIINANCAVAGCHVAPVPTGGIDFNIDCNIVAFKDRIKERAVDQFGTANQMPPPPNPGLSLANRNTIVNWINAGGRYTD
jgi:hypothetical protein